MKPRKEGVEGHPASVPEAAVGAHAHIAYSGRLCGPISTYGGGPLVVARSVVAGIGVVRAGVDEVQHAGVEGGRRHQL